MVPVKLVRVHPDARIPEYKTPRSSGADLYAIEDTIIRPGEMVTLRTGIKLEIPDGYEGLLEVQIRPRSGMAVKTRLRIANPPGTVDCDYRGELHVMIDNITPPIAVPYIRQDNGHMVPEIHLAASKDVKLVDGSYMQYTGNYGSEELPIGTYLVRKGDRIAQLVLGVVHQMTFMLSAEGDLSDTERGEGGLGSTGVR